MFVARECGYPLVTYPFSLWSRKLAPKFIGHFSIVMVLSPMAVRLKLPHYLQRVHPVFHVTCIKPIIRPPSSPSPPSRPVLVEGSPSYRVKKLLAAARPREGVFQYLVDWEGYGPEERSWIPAWDILDCSLIEDLLSPASGEGYCHEPGLTLVFFSFLFLVPFVVTICS